MLSTERFANKQRTKLLLLVNNELKAKDHSTKINSVNHSDFLESSKNNYLIAQTNDVSVHSPMRRTHKCNTYSYKIPEYSKDLLSLNNEYGYIKPFNSTKNISKPIIEIKKEAFKDSLLSQNKLGKTFAERIVNELHEQAFVSHQILLGIVNRLKRIEGNSTQSSLKSVSTNLDSLKEYLEEDLFSKNNYKSNKAYINDRSIDHQIELNKGSCSDDIYYIRLIPCRKDSNNEGKVNIRKISDKFQIELFECK